jgi:hypothetical protein
MGASVRFENKVRVIHWQLGGVNHCRSYCRMAKSPGLLYRGKYSAVIGLKEPVAWKLILGTYQKTFRPMTALYCPPEATEFRQML